MTLILHIIPRMAIARSRWCSLLSLASAVAFLSIQAAPSNALSIDVRRTYELYDHDAAPRVATHNSSNAEIINKRQVSKRCTPKTGTTSQSQNPLDGGGGAQPDTGSTIRNPALSHTVTSLAVSSGVLPNASQTTPVGAAGGVTSSTRPASAAPTGGATSGKKVGLAWTDGGPGGGTIQQFITDQVG